MTCNFVYCSIVSIELDFLLVTVVLRLIMLFDSFLQLQDQIGESILMN